MAEDVTTFPWQLDSEGLIKPRPQLSSNVETHVSSMAAWQHGGRMLEMPAVPKEMQQLIRGCWTLDYKAWEWGRGIIVEHEGRANQGRVSPNMPCTSTYEYCRVLAAKQEGEVVGDLEDSWILEQHPKILGTFEDACYISFSSLHFQFFSLARSRWPASNQAFSIGISIKITSML